MVLPEVSQPTAFGVTAYPPGATYGPRRMCDWEFVWLMQGDAEYTWGVETLLAPEGSFVLCRPGETDFFRWDRKKRTRHAYIHFQMMEVPRDVSSWPLVCEPVPEDILPSLFRHILSWMEREELSQAQQSLQFMLSIFCTGKRSLCSVASNAWPPAVEVVCAHIFARLEENPAAKLTLEEMASVACVTPEYLCRLFQSSLGYSPVKTMRLARLKHAATLLSRSNYSVGEIAALVGYVSPYHFSRAFKEAYGLSPSDMRRHLQKTGQPPAPRLVQAISSLRSSLPLIMSISDK